MRLTLLCVAVALSVLSVDAQRGSSLRGALEALQRRQRGYDKLPIEEDGTETIYEIMQPYSEDEYDMNGNRALEPNVIVKVLDESKLPLSAYKYETVKKNSRDENRGSAFRERNIHENGAKDFIIENELEKVTPLEISKHRDEQYANFLKQLWSDYKNNQHTSKIPNHSTSAKENNFIYNRNVDKRYTDSWGPIAYKKKRSSGSETDFVAPDNDERRPMQDVIASNPYDVYEIPNDAKGEAREEYAIAFQPLDDEGVLDDMNEQYSYDSAEKPFMISKRSAGKILHKGKINRSPSQSLSEDYNRVLRSSSGTSAQTLEHLSKIFGDAKVVKAIVKRSSDTEDKSHESHDTHHSAKTQKRNQHNTHAGYLKDRSHEHLEAHQGMTGLGETAKKDSNTPIVKKRSINWHDYFGIDKRNFLSESSISNVHHRQFKAMVPLDKSKIGSDNIESIGIQLNFKRNVDQQEAPEDYDVKSKEEILTKLANEYSMEKMRKALEEYKASIIKQINTVSPPHGAVEVTKRSNEQSTTMTTKTTDAPDQEEFKGPNLPGLFKDATDGEYINIFRSKDGKMLFKESA